MKLVLFSSFCFFSVLMFILGHFTGSWHESPVWFVPVILAVVGVLLAICGFFNIDW